MGVKCAGIIEKEHSIYHFDCSYSVMYHNAE